MYNPYGIQMNVDRINQQIQELQRIKEGFQAIPQTQLPIQNIINTGNGQNIDFEARMLGENEKPDEILVQRKTAFIDLKNGQLTIKEINGDMKAYEIVLPKTEEQLKIEELERRLREYELGSNNEIGESTTNDNEPNEPTTKGFGRAISKKS